MVPPTSWRLASISLTDASYWLCTSVRFSATFSSACFFSSSIFLSSASLVTPAASATFCSSVLTIGATVGTNLAASAVVIAPLAKAPRAFSTTSMAWVVSPWAKSLAMTSPTSTLTESGTAMGGVWRSSLRVAPRTSRRFFKSACLAAPAVLSASRFFSIDSLALGVLIWI